MIRRIKNLRKSTKVGLVTTGIYAASTLALPLLVAAKEEPKPVPVETINLEGVNTVKDARNLFQSKLEEYCVDGELNLRETENVHSILVKEKQLLDKDKSIVSGSYIKAKKESAEIAKKKSGLEEELENLKEPNGMFLDYLSEQREKIEFVLEKEYPGIIDKKHAELNISYSSYIKPKKSIKRLLKQTAKDVHYTFSLEYDDQSLKHISEKNEKHFRLRDAAEILLVMKDYETMLGSSQTNFTTKKGSLVEEIQALELQEKEIWKKITGKEKTGEIEAYLESQSDLTGRLKKFSDYFTFKDRADEFIEKFGDRNVYWSGSLLEHLILKYTAGGLYKFLNNKDNQVSIENNLNQYLSSVGLTGKVKELKNPTDHKFPMWFFVLVNGFTFPIVRNLFIRWYMGKATGGKADDDAYAASFFAGAGNGLLGVLVTDGLHPLAFPARMLLPPIFIQPYKRIFKKNW